MANRHSLKSIFITTALLLLAMPSTAQDRITDLRFWEAPEKTRMVIDLTAGAGYKVFSLDTPPRLVIDLQDTKSLPDNKLPTISSKIIRGVRIASRDKDDTRIVIDLRHALKMEHFALGPQQPYGHRIVVDMFVPDKVLPEEDPVIAIIQKRLYEQQKASVKDQAEESEKPAQQAQPSFVASRDVIVAVDAGHGGEDPGAIGKGRTLEKTVVLAIAKALQQHLEKQPGVTAMLTRKDDYFLTLADRVSIAKQKYHADFFVSIHADSAGRHTARGASVYVLGERGVDRTLNLYLSEQEQTGNALGAEDQKMQTSLHKVMADLSLNGSMSHSKLAAEKIADELSKVSQMHSRKVKTNNFQVLRNPYMPAILVETGFISNRQDEQLLLNSRHRQKLADSISKGIVSYFKQQPPPGSYFASLRDQPVLTHVVKRNEFLSTIAQKYKTSVSVIKETNKLSSDSLRIGQKLTITKGQK